MFWDMLDRFAESKAMLAIISVIDWLGTVRRPRVYIGDFELFIIFAMVAWIAALFLAFGGKR